MDRNELSRGSRDQLVVAAGANTSGEDEDRPAGAASNTKMTDERPNNGREAARLKAPHLGSRSRGLGREVAAAWDDKDFPRLERALHSHARVDTSDCHGCVLWEGGKTLSGYGYIQAPDGRQFLVHRILGYASAGFPTPRGFNENVRHACAKKPCIASDHLSLGTARQNTQEGFARYELDKLINELLSVKVLETREEPDSELCRVINAVDELRDRDVTQRNAIEQIGAISRTKYENQRKRLFPERVNGKPRRHGIEECIANKDAAGILGYVRNHVSRNPTATGCWNWTGRLTNKRPSTGTGDTHRYVQRVLEWGVRGCPGALKTLPPVWRHCENLLCLNPGHLRLITENLNLIHPGLRIPLLKKIAELGGVVDSTWLDRARLSVEFTEFASGGRR
jgi:hypothetical protein